MLAAGHCDSECVVYFALCLEAASDVPDADAAAAFFSIALCCFWRMISASCSFLFVSAFAVLPVEAFFFLLVPAFSARF